MVEDDRVADVADHHAVMVDDHDALGLFIQAAAFNEVGEWVSTMISRVLSVSTDSACSVEIKTFSPPPVRRCPPARARGSAPG